MYKRIVNIHTYSWEHEYFRAADNSATYNDFLPRPNSMDLACRIKIFSKMFNEPLILSFGWLSTPTAKEMGTNLGF